MKPSMADLVASTIRARRGWRAGVCWRAAVSLAALGLVAMLVDWTRVIAALRTASPWGLVAVMATIQADRVWMAWKWLLLARASGLTLSAGAAVKSYYVGSFWGGFLPVSVGADVIRISWLTRHGHDAGKVTWTVVVERGLGALAQTVTGIAAVVVLPLYTDIGARALTGSLALLAAITLAAVLLLFSRSVYDLAAAVVSRLRCSAIAAVLVKARQVVMAYRQRPALLLAFVTLSVLQQGFPLLAMLAMATSFTVDVDVTRLILGVPIMLTIIRLPLSINDYGIREGVYAAVLSFAGVNLSEAVMLAIVDRLLGQVAMLPGAFWSLRGRPALSAPAAVAPDPAPALTLER